MCKQKLNPKTCNNINFYLCKWEIDGVVREEFHFEDGSTELTEEMKKGESTNPDKYVTFKEAKKVKWEYLEISVMKLQ